MTRAESLRAWCAGLPWARRLAVRAQAEAILDVRWLPDTDSAISSQALSGRAQVSALVRPSSNTLISAPSVPASRNQCSPARAYVLALAGTVAYPTAASVAQAVGLSRERVRQILRSAGREEYHRRGVPPGLAPLCECGEPRSLAARLCPACRHAAHWRILSCETCGRRFSRTASDVRAARRLGYRHVWCSKRCQGFWLTALALARWRLELVE